MCGQHHLQRPKVARQRQRQNLRMFAAGLFTRKIADLEGQHAVAQALVIHDAVKCRQPARGATFDQRGVKGAVVGFQLGAVAFGVFSTRASIRDSLW